MTEFVFFCNELIFNLGSNSTYIYAILSLVGLLFIIQISYYFHYSSVIIKKSKRKKAKIRKRESVSVVVVVQRDLYWIETILPTILAQKCDDFEVVVVDMGEELAVSDMLSTLKGVYPHLVITTFKHNPKFPISAKMAYNIGIKSSSKENILLTSTDAMPASEFWIKEFEDAFRCSDVVIGYAGLEVEKKSVAMRLIKLSRVMVAVRYMSSAISGIPYKGSISNLGFRKDLYFSVNGFNFLNMNIGIDDLFLQKITTKNNTSVLVSKSSAVMEFAPNSISTNRDLRRFYDSTYQFYPKNIRYSIVAERISRVLFFLFAVIALIFLPFALKLGVVGALFVRLIVVMININLISRKLGERGIIYALPLHDLISPFDAFISYIHLKIKPIRRVWR